nr:hypothetical protein Iba_chr12bCG26260 [Ipomoea batatas]
MRVKHPGVSKQSYLCRCRGLDIMMIKFSSLQPQILHMLLIRQLGDDLTSGYTSLYQI